MNVYIYQASLYCEPCARKIKIEFAEGKRGDIPPVTCRNLGCGWKGPPDETKRNYAGWYLCPDCDEKDFGASAYSAAHDEYTYDSDDYPKGPIADGGGEADDLQFCDDCGCSLENSLTTEGTNRVVDAVLEHLTNTIESTHKGEREYIAAALQLTRDDAIDWRVVIVERLDALLALRHRKDDEGKEI